MRTDPDKPPLHASVRVVSGGLSGQEPPPGVEGAELGVVDVPAPEPLALDPVDPPATAEAIASAEITPAPPRSKPCAPIGLT